MNRILRLLVVITLMSGCLRGAQSASAADRRWNVVLILADDLGAHDPGFAGSRFHETPNLDRLAAEGMRFTQAYSACTVCSPTRAAVMTGQHPARLKITDWIRGHDAPRAKLRPPTWTMALPLEIPTLADRLAGLDGGYTTAHLGKWHLGGEGFEPERQGFQQNLGGDHRGQPPSYFVPYGLPRLSDGPVGEYLTGREGAEAVRFVREHKDRPFFLNYCPYAVHTPLQAPSNLVAKYHDKASRVGGPQTNAVYAAMLERLDAAVGSLREALHEAGIEDRTVVIFTSDNGGLVLGQSPPTSNAPLRSGKGSPYEGGVRVPLVVHWPGVTRPGSASAVPVQSIDLFPTVLQIVAGERAAAELKVDGRSLVPLLREPDAAWDRPALYWHYPHYHPGGATPYAAIRAGDWKLIQYYESGRHELFNLREDPAEAHDLAGAQPERVLELSRQLFAWQGNVGAQWPMPNPDWTPTALPAAPDGAVRLHARDAFVHSTVLRYEPQPFKNTLGWWTRPEDWASWQFVTSQPHRYRVEARHGCGTGSGGSVVEFKVGTQTLPFTVEATGGFQNWTNRTIGEVELPAGTHALEVRPVRKPALAVMDLQEVTLHPITD